MKQNGSENLLDGASTGIIEMSLTEEVTNYYILEINWNKDKTSYEYSNTLDYVKIIVDSYQKD